ncbi:MAG: hypothetical protein H0T62_09905 [Parachlamydiaceae bacterium]|nr:hypothetical protein [Parachlamydiaceae bacterium]
MDPIAFGFNHTDLPHKSPVKYLKTIYLFEAERVISVFFEFIESTEAKAYLNRVCYEASKMDLHPDRRIPLEAKQGFCYGFTAREGETVPQLIKKVEGAMTWGNKTEFEVPLTIIKAFGLTSNPCKMPAKDYSDVFCCNYSNQWT